MVGRHQHKGFIEPGRSASGIPMAKRKLVLPEPWSDFEIFTSKEFPENLTREAELLDERFRDVHQIFKALGAQILENSVGRSDVIMCNVCGIMFYPENPDSKCPLCSLVRWIANYTPVRKTVNSGGKEEIAPDSDKPHPLFQDWADDE